MNQQFPGGVRIPGQGLSPEEELIARLMTTARNTRGNNASVVPPQPMNPPPPAPQPVLSGPSPIVPSPPAAVGVQPQPPPPAPVGLQQQQQQQPMVPPLGDQIMLEALAAASQAAAGHRQTPTATVVVHGPTEPLLSIPSPEAELPSLENMKLTDIKNPHPNDVLCGRGGGTNNHPGNERYRELVQAQKLNYLRSSKRDKLQVSIDIVRAVRAQDPPGRFLNRDDSANGRYYDIGDSKAREKTSQALREGAPDIRQRINVTQTGISIQVPLPGMEESHLPEEAAANQNVQPVNENMGQAAIAQVAHALNTSLNEVAQNIFAQQQVQAAQLAAAMAASGALPVAPQAGPLPGLLNPGNPQQSQLVAAASGQPAPQNLLIPGLGCGLLGVGGQPNPLLPGLGRGIPPALLPGLSPAQLAQLGLNLQSVQQGWASLAAPQNTTNEKVLLKPSLAPLSDDLAHRLVLAETIAQRSVNGRITEELKKEEKRMGLYLDAGLLGIEPKEMTDRLSRGETEEVIVEDHFNQLKKEKRGEKRRLKSTGLSMAKKPRLVAERTIFCEQDIHDALVAIGAV